MAGALTRTEEKMNQTLNREIHLKSRPVGMPRPENFELVTMSIPQPGEGEVLVRNIYMSVDPYMRGRMIDRKSYAPPFQLGEVMSGGCVGQVAASNHNKLKVGDYVSSMYGWREYYTSDGRGLSRIDPNLAPIQSYLGTMGMPGRTAYVGLLDIGQLKEGETVFVSAAAGAVGSVACQIAKIKGCKVIGSAGSAAKVSWLVDELGIDAAFNYKEVGKLSAELARRAPEGIDVYFDNVGGDHLEAALAQMNSFGRVVCCGMISQYNATEPTAAPRNLNFIVTKRLTLRGFIVSDHRAELPRIEKDMATWLAQGRLTWQVTIVDGLENAPEAFIRLFTGEKMGKMLVRIGPDPTA
jgi:NADPH-dependent curcumin reductase CurA